MLDRLEALEAEYSQVLTRLSDPTLSKDRNELRVLSRRHKELEGVVHKMHELRSAQDDVAVARELAADAVGAERELGRDELDAAEARVVALETELRDLLIPKDPNDGRNVIVEIRGAEGGEEANLFAKDLFDMYQRYAADHRGWRVEVLDLRESRARRGRRGHLSHQRRGRLAENAPRGWDSPGAADPGHRVPRARPHLVCNRQRLTRGR